MSFIKFLIDKSEIVGFDVFDTLIERDVCIPSDIFEIVGIIVFNSYYDAKKFAKKRVLAEKVARDNNYNREISIDDIYKELKKDYENYEELKAKEIEVELSSCRPIHTMIENLNYAVKKKRRVFLISDMYLPKFVVSQILQSCNITGFEEIYVSCEVGCNKLTGSLFEFICKEKGLDKRRFIHFGDSFKADMYGACKAGIKGYPIQRKNRIKRFIYKWIKSKL